MRFNFARISTFLFASAVLVDSSPQRSSQFDVVKKRATSSSEQTQSAWGGAVLIQNTPTFYLVSGTFKVPHVTGPNYSSVGIWVGIDGEVECGSYVQAGVGCIINSDGELSYTAVVEWVPEPWRGFTEIDVSPGDVITVEIGVNSDHTSGHVTFKNVKNGTNQTVVQTLEFEDYPALCQLSAEWVVETIQDMDLANFNVVAFRSPVALGEDGQRFTPAGSAISEISQNEKVETIAYVDEEVVAIWYIDP